MDEAELERIRHRKRTFSVFPGDDGMYVVRGMVDPEGALLMRAIEAAGDALYKAGLSWSADGGAYGPTTEEVTPEQRRADALGLLAERALAAGFGIEVEDERDEDEEDDEGEAAAGQVDHDSLADVRPPGAVSVGQGGFAESGRAVSNASAPHPSESAVRGREPASGAQIGSAESGRPVASASASRAGEPVVCHCKPAGRGPTPLSGTRAERYMVVLHVSPSSLKKNDEVGRSNLQDGTRVSAETARRLACDCSVVQVTRGEQGEVLNVGRKRRTIPPALRRALEIRDGGCRFPGCGSKFCDCHHIIHWEDGGETCLDNLCLACKHHHRALHEEGFSVRMLSDGTFRFHDRSGWPLPDFTPPPELEEDPVEALIRQNRASGVDPDGSARSARYERSVDIPWSLEAGVCDALDP